MVLMSLLGMEQSHLVVRYARLHVYGYCNSLCSTVKVSVDDQLGSGEISTESEMLMPFSSDRNNLSAMATSREAMINIEQESLPTSSIAIGVTLTMLLIILSTLTIVLVYMVVRYVIITLNTS